MFKHLFTRLGLISAKDRGDGRDTDGLGRRPAPDTFRLVEAADALERARAALGLAMADDECLLRRLTRLEARAAELEASDDHDAIAERARVEAEREGAERARRTLADEILRLKAETRDAAALHAVELRELTARRRGEPAPRGGFGRIETTRSFEATLADAEASLARLRARRLVHGA